MRKMFLAAIAATMLAGAAQAVDVDFAFTGNVAGGTVTGTLFGLADNATSDPTDLLAYYQGVTYTYAATGIYGGFTVQNGIVTGASFQANVANPQGNGYPNLTLGLMGFNQLVDNPNGVLALDTRGAAGITFTTRATAAPEPAAWAMFLAGFGLVGTALRRRRTDVAYA